jgi:hypothetical protein
MTTFQLRNAGKQAHELGLVKLTGGKTLGDVLAALRADGPDPVWKGLAGGPGAVLPGSEGTATLALEPGQYVVFCGVPGEDHMPHAMKGMIKTLTVTPSTHTGQAPTADDTVTMVDFDFKLSAPLTAGPHTMRIVNAGSQAHMLLLLRLQPGKTLDDMLAWDRAPQGPPPVAWSAGASALRAGGALYVHTDLVPGTYALLCFLTDDTDGTSHIAHGMRKQFTVQ